jgi:Fe-S-cluster containining protein
VRDPVQIEEADRQLLTSIASSMAEAVRRSGEWIACRPGCTQCCIGGFAITQLDAMRLRRGLAALEGSDPERAKRVRARAAAYIETAGPLGELRDEDQIPPSLDEAACPALDPETGWCDLYEARPITCRTFGPATRVGDGMIAACELCYEGAGDEDIARCAVEIDPEGIERELVAGEAFTTVAHALKFANLRVR